MNLKKYSESELLMEISKRIDKKRITWGTVYLYNADKREFWLRSEEVREGQKFQLIFTQEARTEHNLFANKIYKSLEPMLLKMEQKQVKTDYLKKIETFNKKLKN